MKAAFKRFLKLFLGWALVLLGVIGWFLPFLPGTPFVFLGVALLSAQSEWVRHRMESLRLRFPREAARLQRLKEELFAKFKREHPSDD